MNPMDNVGPAKCTIPDYYACMMQYYNPGCICNVRLAHAYVPFQTFQCVYPPMVGLRCGTIFPELSRPYGSDPEYTIDQ